jgi:hypothetical protein
MPCMMTGASEGMAPAWLATRSAPPSDGIFSRPLPLRAEPFGVDRLVDRTANARVRSERPHSSTSETAGILDWSGTQVAIRIGTMAVERFFSVPTGARWPWSHRTDP